MKKSIIVLLVLFGLGIFLWQGIYSPKSSALTEEELFSVEEGESLLQIAANLEEDGLIKSRFLFELYVFITAAQGKLQAGEYSLSPSESCAKIAKKSFAIGRGKIIPILAIFRIYRS